MQPGLVHSFVTWQAGKEEWETVGFIFLVLFVFFLLEAMGEGDNFWQGK